MWQRLRVKEKAAKFIHDKTRTVFALRDALYGGFTSRVRPTLTVAAYARVQKGTARNTWAVQV